MAYIFNFLTNLIVYSKLEAKGIYIDKQNYRLK